MELEKTNTDNDSKKKKALTDVKAIEEKLAKHESLVKKTKQNKPKQRNIKMATERTVYNPFR